MGHIKRPLSYELDPDQDDEEWEEYWRAKEEDYRSRGEADYYPEYESKGSSGFSMDTWGNLYFAKNRIDHHE